MPKALDEKTIEDIKKLVSDGKNPAQIGKRLDISQYIVKKYFAENKETVSSSKKKEEASISPEKKKEIPNPPKKKDDLTERLEKIEQSQAQINNSLQILSTAPAKTISEVKGERQKEIDALRTQFDQKLTTVASAITKAVGEQMQRLQESLSSFKKPETNSNPIGTGPEVRQPTVIPGGDPPPTQIPSIPSGQPSGMPPWLGDILQQVVQKVISGGGIGGGGQSPDPVESLISQAERLEKLKAYFTGKSSSPTKAMAEGLKGIADTFKILEIMGIKPTTVVENIEGKVTNHLK